MAFCLAGLAAGLWPQAIYPSRRDVVAAPLPTLQALAAAQALFILLAHPIVLLARAERRRVRRFWPEAVAESAVLLAATVPLYVLCAFLANATLVEVARVCLYLACLWPAAWAAGRLMSSRQAARPAVLAGLLVVAALPAVYYLCREFLIALPVGWLWHLAPAGQAWDLGQPRPAELLGAPAWALAVWPVVAALLGLLSAGGATRIARRGV